MLNLIYNLMVIFQNLLRPFGLIVVLGVLIVGCHHSGRVSMHPPSHLSNTPPNGGPNDKNWRNTLVVIDSRYHVSPEFLDEDKYRGTALFDEANELIAQNRFKESIDMLVVAATHLPDSSKVYERLGQVLLFKGNFEGARFALRAAIDENSWNNRARALLAKSLMAEGRIDEAIDQWMMLAAFRGDVGEAHKNLAICFYYQRNYEQAQRHLNNADVIGHQVPSQFRAMLSERLADVRSGVSE